MEARLSAAEPTRRSPTATATASPRSLLKPACCWPGAARFPPAAGLPAAASWRRCSRCSPDSAEAAVAEGAEPA